MRDYYVQRATAGLIVTEGAHPSAQGRGYFHTPGLYTDEQAAGWQLITDAVHAAGGRIFVQLMHAGRIAFRETIPDGSLPVAPSAVRPDPDYRGYSYACPRPRRHYDTPRALETDEVVATIMEYRRATEYALAAYNAGDVPVRQWMSSEDYKDVAEFVESIPYTETREYVQAILRNRELYRAVVNGHAG